MDLPACTATCNERVAGGYGASEAPSILDVMGLVRRRGDEGWDGVEPRAYASGAERHVLIGPDDGARQVELRYFRIPVGGATVRERHPHEHAIVILHGRARVTLGERVHDAGPGDAVFVASDELHELRVVGDAPLGFICTALVDRASRPATSR
jgi:quercetin dioxygenase-like cupin family protein